MFPLSLLNAAEGHPVRVELKNGESFNGTMVQCDNLMNLTLNDVLITSAEGDRFWNLKEAYIRGAQIKFLHLPDEVLTTSKTSASAPCSNATSSATDKAMGMAWPGRIPAARWVSKPRRAGWQWSRRIPEPTWRVSAARWVQ
ncbi:hypothetical protein BCR44DRAFT_1388953 [Catenaria anguillulae PL171]|uniref:LSM complex subunit LSM4 n=1 Tax=Catenaria anguillulae PL171 TaxID=765915 RepID=A0A1Y2HPQ5_9FUNG|nr:hypothetical protein BCR44DRAFT_1388953 [Catenaria anguillulae PL171]